ncbi:hypothetical protein BRD04_08985 [Halobacteriales archaeon QS_9_67_17]|nr:MAG: hypothetical protein BRD04_08985 [Halobacteriales archaeon QS_9_67_17]
MKLRNRLVIALCLVGLVLGTTTYVGFELFQDRSVEQSRANVNETAAMSADIVEGQVRERKGQVAYVAAQPAARGDNVDAYIESFVQNSRFVSAHTLSEDGTVQSVYSAPGTPKPVAEGDRRATAQYAERALDGRTYMSPVFCAKEGRCRVRISAPIIDASSDGGSVVGVLAATIPVRGGVFFEASESGTPNTAVYVVAPTDDGDIIFGGEPPNFAASITGKATVASTDWTVRVTRNRAGLNTRLRTAFYAQLVSLLVVLGSVAMFGAWEYRTNLRHVDRLLDGFDALRDGDYDHSLDLSDADEWSSIERRFAGLAATLAERETEVEEQRQRRRMLYRLLRHNLRNELNVVIMEAERIPDYTEDAEVADIADNVVDTSRRLIDQADKARKLERLMADAAKTEPTEVTALVSAELADLRTEYDATVTAEMVDEAWVEAPSLLSHAIRELCENAVEHNSADPVVGVAVERADESVLLRIRDDGPGINAQDRRALSDETETRLEHGSGIGLRFVYWTVERMDGSAAVIDNDLGGTTITLRLPAIPSPTAQEHETTEQE